LVTQSSATNISHNIDIHVENDQFLNLDREYATRSQFGILSTYLVDENIPTDVTMYGYLEHFKTTYKYIRDKQEHSPNT